MQLRKLPPASALGLPIRGVESSGGNKSCGLLAKLLSLVSERLVRHTGSVRGIYLPVFGCRPVYLLSYDVGCHLANPGCGRGRRLQRSCVPKESVTAPRTPTAHQNTKWFLAAGCAWVVPRILTRMRCTHPFGIALRIAGMWPAIQMGHTRS